VGMEQDVYGMGYRMIQRDDSRTMFGASYAWSKSD
jgi:hypothetical protein